MAHRGRRKLVQGAEPAPEVVALIDGFAAVANALKESTDALPAVKGIFGAVDWIVANVKQFQSNKSDWNDLAIFVLELFHRVRDKINAIGGRLGLETELQTHLKTLERALLSVHNGMIKMKQRPWLSVVLQTREDPKRIAGFRQIIDDASKAFLLSEVVAIHTQVDTTHVKVTAIGSQLAKISDNLKVLTDGAQSGESSRSKGKKFVANTCPAPTQSFTGREDILEQLAAYFHPDNEVVGQKRFILYGLGGIGKTQIAYRYIQVSQQHDDPSSFAMVFKVDSSSEETIAADYKSIALAYRVGESAEDAKRWLASNRERWLLLLDNADSINMDLRQHIPAGSNGNILITTRDQGKRILSPEGTYHVPQMKPSEAEELLLKFTGSGSTIEAKAEAASLAKELGYIPLAIIQAAAYMVETLLSLPDYHRSFLKKRGALLEKYKTLRNKPDDYKWTVFTTWSMSRDELLKQDKNAVLFLQLCSFLHHEGISEAIFSRASVKIVTDMPFFSVPVQPSPGLEFAVQFLNSFRDDSGEWDHDKFTEMVGLICAFSLIDSETMGSTYSIHPLVHEWMRESTEPRDPVLLGAQYICGLSIDFKESLDGVTFRRRLLPHAQACISYGDPHVGPDIQTSIAKVLEEGGSWSKVEHLRELIYVSRKDILSHDDQDVLSSTSNLATTYLDQGRFQEAEGLILKVLEGLKRTLDENDPEVLRAMTNLSGIYFNQGRLPAAEALQLKVLEERRKVWGEDHPAVLRIMNNLSQTYSSWGRLQEAEILALKVVEGLERYLGGDHPQAVSAMGNLASIYSSLGRFEEAETLEVKVLDSRKRTVGEGHPDSLTAMSNLARTYWDQGRLQEAEKLEVKVLEGRRKAMGDEHPHVLLTMSNLALTRRDLGRYKEAEELLIDVVEARERVLGTHHPHTQYSVQALELLRNEYMQSQ